MTDEPLEVPVCPRCKQPITPEQSRRVVSDGLIHVPCMTTGSESTSPRLIGDDTDYFAALQDTANTLLGRPVADDGEGLEVGP